MSVLETLPARPLSASELASLNRVDSIELAVSVGDDDAPATSILLATDAWVKALVFDSGAWRVVETVTLDDVERFEALRACEDAVLNSEEV